MTAAPTASTSPANSMPRIRRFGRRRPVKKRLMNGFALRSPQSVRVDRRRVDPDEDLVVLRDGPLDVCEAQDVRRPVPVVDDCSHRAHFRLEVDRAAAAPRAAGAVELRGPAAGRAGPRAAPGRDHPAVLGDDAPPEVRGVELHAPDRLVHGPQLGEGERRPDERRRDARDLELDADALDRVAHDLQMVEREVDLAVEHVGDGDQRRRCGVRAADDRADVAERPRGTRP